MKDAPCPFCGAYSPRQCEMEEELGVCPWEESEPDPDILREDLNERRQLDRDIPTWIRNGNMTKEHEGKRVLREDEDVFVTIGVSEISDVLSYLRGLEKERDEALAKVADFHEELRQRLSDHRKRYPG